MISRPLSNKGKTDVRNKDMSFYLIDSWVDRLKDSQKKNINRYIERKKERKKNERKKDIDRKQKDNTQKD